MIKWSNWFALVSDNNHGLSLSSRMCAYKFLNLVTKDYASAVLSVFVSGSSKINLFISTWIVHVPTSLLTIRQALARLFNRSPRCFVDPT